VSDLHCGCRLGLCPRDGIALTDGGEYLPSSFQKTLFGWWQEFWSKWVPQVTNGEPYDVVVNGETVDGVHHKATTHISANLEDQKATAVAILHPVVKQCPGRFYVVSGTPVHSGEQGCDDEAVARELGALKDSNGRHARYELWIDVGGALVHVSHHIGTTGSAAYESSAVMKELTEAYVEAGRWGDRPPDVIVRSHRHRNIEIKVPSEHGTAIACVTPGWQGKTPFCYRIPGARQSQPQFGGIVVRVDGSGAPYIRERVWRLDRGKIE